MKTVTRFTCGLCIFAAASDENGHFSVQAGMEGTLVFSAIGYQTLLVAARDVKGPVYLQQAAMTLQKVTVKGWKKLRSTRIGNVTGKTLVSTGGASQYAMLLLPPPSSIPVLEEVAYMSQPDSRKNDRWKTAVMVRVYANENGRQGRDLLPGNLVLAVNKAERKVVPEIADHAIVVPEEGVFIGIDFIGFFDVRNNFYPYSKQNRPLNLRILFTNFEAPYQTYSKFFGTTWQAAHHRDSFGKQSRISAKFGAEMTYPHRSAAGTSKLLP